MNNSPKLTRHEKRVINLRAQELAAQSFRAYRDRLTEWALSKKVEMGGISMAEIAEVVPNIEDLIDVDRESTSAGGTLVSGA